jgi:hypothetical protein
MNTSTNLLDLVKTAENFGKIQEELSARRVEALSTVATLAKHFNITSNELKTLGVAIDIDLNAVIGENKDKITLKLLQENGIEFTPRQLNMASKAIKKAKKESEPVLLQFKFGAGDTEQVFQYRESTRLGSIVSPKVKTVVNNFKTPADFIKSEYVVGKGEMAKTVATNLYNRVKGISAPAVAEKPAK